MIVSPADFGKLIVNETERWGKVVKPSERQASTTYDFRPGQSRRLWRAQGMRLIPQGAELNLSLAPPRALLTLARFQIFVIEKAIVFRPEPLIAARVALNTKKPGAEAAPRGAWVTVADIVGGRSSYPLPFSRVTMSA
jgi:hypothetical protein